MLTAPSSSRKAPKRDLRFLALSILFIAAGLLTWALSGPRLGSIFPPKLNEKSKNTIGESVKNPPINIAAIKPTDTLAWQQTSQSITALNKQIGQEPGVASYHNRLGILYAQIGDFTAAANQFKQAIGLCRLQLENKTSKVDSAKDQSILYTQLTCAHSNLARLYDKLGDHAGAMAELEALNADVAFSSEATQTRPITKNSISHASNSSQKLTPAEASSLARAEALRYVGRLNEASQEYRNLIKSNPRLAVAHQGLALTAITENNLWLAINELETAAQLDKKDPDTQNDLGLVYEQIGDYTSAQRAFLNAHNIAPKHLSASINLSNLIANKGNYKQGIAIMRQATIDNPRSAIAYNNLAALIARTNNQTEAAKVFAKAINLDPTLPSAHYGLGLALLKLKSYPAAINEFQTAMTLNPGILDLQNKIDLANRCNLRSLSFTQTALK